jgi:hypothetical protein
MHRCMYAWMGCIYGNAFKTRSRPCHAWPAKVCIVGNNRMSNAVVPRLKHSSRFFSQQGSSPTQMHTSGDVIDCTVHGGAILTMYVCTVHTYMEHAVQTDYVYSTDWQFDKAIHVPLGNILPFTGRLGKRTENAESSMN